MTLLIYTVLVYILTVMKKESTFNLQEICELSGISRRTVRYYIQIGMIDSPTGVGRGSHYNLTHLDQLLEIRKWQTAGLSLDRIREILCAEDEDHAVPPPKPRQKGSLDVKSHLFVSDGIELIIDPKRANLQPEDLRKFVDAVMKSYETMINNKRAK